MRLSISCGATPEENLWLYTTVIEKRCGPPYD
jgi:hypothetical protein